MQKDQDNRLTTEEAVEIVRVLYGVEGVATELPGEIDQNFRIDVKEGIPRILKVCRSGESDDTLLSQNQVMLALSKALPDLQFPIPQKSTGGRYLEKLSVDGTGEVRIRLLSFVGGYQWMNIHPKTRMLRRELGATFARIDRVLADGIKIPERELKWDLLHAGWIRAHTNTVDDAKIRSLILHHLEAFERDILTDVSSLPFAVIHNDANYQNVFVGPPAVEGRHISGVIDFGDVTYSARIGELAVAVAYGCLDLPDPLQAAAEIVGGYHAEFPLTDPELHVLYRFVAIRLCVQLVNAAFERSVSGDNEHLSGSEEAATHLLKQWSRIHPNTAWYFFRDACGMAACPNTQKVSTFLEENRSRFAPIVHAPLADDNVSVFDFSVGSTEWGQQITMGGSTSIEVAMKRKLEDEGSEVGLGRYNEARLAYVGDQYLELGNNRDKQRTIHLGVDIFLPDGTPVHAPLEGVIHSFRDNNENLDYGPTLILRHEGPDDIQFYTLYGHLSRSDIDNWYEGKVISSGEIIGHLGAREENGGWSPHLHFQIVSDMLGNEGNFAGVACADERSVYTSICPDPNLILGIDKLKPAPNPVEKSTLTGLREAHLGPNLSISYRQPLHIVRGKGAYLFDEEGRSYLDCVNNVCHVGHAHPDVVRAAAEQMSALNTNTRYLHEHLITYSHRLTDRLPECLEIAWMVCSGSEANELALRLARNYTNSYETIVIDVGYHGNTTALIDVSPYKHNSRGGKGPPPHVHTVPMPDPYRGPFKRIDSKAGEKYAAFVGEAVDNIVKRGKRPVFLAESILSCGGQIEFPSGYLKKAYEYVRAADGVCIADEVQTGFGRVGSHFWAFETQGVVPDIVTMGKPIGNGHPLAAVVTRRNIADAFDNGMEYFNTFGGNPVSCRIGLEVLSVIDRENLQEHAKDAGEFFLKKMRELQTESPLIGDVRGRGLFLGLELIRDRDTLEPADDEADYFVNRMREKGFLLSTDGPHHNVIKMKPPMVISVHDIERVTSAMREVLDEDFLKG